MRYHAYLGILAFVDQSEEFRLGEQSQLQRRATDADTFRQACRQYKDKLLKRQRSIRRPLANSVRRDDLYEPYSCLAFGHSDNVIVTLCDLIDPLFILSQESELSFEQVSLAFCPRLQSLNLPDREKRWLEEPHEFVRASHKPAESSLPISKTPLLLVSRLKIGGIAKLASREDITEPLLRAIANRIDTIIGNVVKHDNEEEVQACFPNSAKWKESLDHIPLKCSIYESQGVAELTLIIRSDDYALPAIILHQLRALTLGDIFKFCPSAGTASQGFARQVHELLGDATGVAEGKDPTLEQNHVFATSYSTPCVDPNVWDLNLDSLNGRIAVDVNWVVSPGHLEQAALLVDSLENHPMTPRSASKYYHVRFGKFDLEYRLGSLDLPVVEIGAFLRTAQRLCESITTRGDRKRETGILDMSCIISVPIPKGFSLQSQGEDHMRLAPVHAVLSQETRCRSNQNQVPPKCLWYNRQVLEGYLKVLGIPRRLRDSIVYLFSNFFYCLNEPKLFDSVLDLTDAFRTTYSAFETSARLERKVTPADLVDLEQHIAALEDACYYRQCLTLPQHELNDLAVHFRGGLNQLLNGADVFLKVGLGIIRWLAETGVERRLDAFQAPSHLGAITQLCFAMQPRCAISTFAFRHNHGLPHLKLNVGHIFHINEFVHYMHEMGHVLQALLGTQQRSQRTMVRAYARQQRDNARLSGEVKKQFTKCSRVWTREIYAEAFVYCFVCGFDLDVYLSQHFAGFSAQADRFPPGYTLPGNEAERFQEIWYTTLDRLLVGFFATSLFSPVWGERLAPTQRQTHFDNELAAFIDNVKKHFGWYVYQEELAKDPAEYEKFWRQLREAAGRMAFSVSKGMWGPCQEIGRYFRQYYSELFGIANLHDSDHLSNDEKIKERLHQVDQRVADNVRRGMPVTKSCVDGLLVSQRLGCDHMLLLCCSMVRTYLRFCLHGNKPSSQLQYIVRRDTQGKMRWPCEEEEPRVPARFLVDSGFAGYLCIHEKDRRACVRWSTSIHKSLQGFSVELRLRRLERMLLMNQNRQA